MMSFLAFRPRILAPPMAFFFGGGEDTHFAYVRGLPTKECLEYTIGEPSSIITVACRHELTNSKELHDQCLH